MPGYRHLYVRAISGYTWLYGYTRLLDLYVCEVGLDLDPICQSGVCGVRASEGTFRLDQIHGLFNATFQISTCPGSGLRVHLPLLGNYY